MKQRAFTLIELLAVIVILVIIVLVTVPMILNLVENSKKSSFEDSVYGIIESAKLLYTEMMSDGVLEGSKTFSFDYGKPEELNYHGLTPEGGMLILERHGEIRVAVHNHTWCAIKEADDNKVKILKYEEGKCVLTGNSEFINADKSGAEKPTLAGLVPIKWNGTTWIKADENNGAGEHQWYDYGQWMWANAASVTEEYRNVSVGDEIPESAINAYFVWIPRYEYDYVSIQNDAGGTKAQPGEIKVNFIAVNKTNSSENYVIHPAFTFGDQELSGFWVGKFETTGNATTPTIKPNINSLRYMNVSNMFTTAQKFSASENNYGINTSADAHMMKSSEWGAVAYLSQSTYGKYGNDSYLGANKEVYINNNSSYITGCSGGTPSAGKSGACVYTYEKPLDGTGASTTGTIYGVYDMSGGSHEYVMALYNENKGSSGFSSLPERKYYDNYTSTSVATACEGELCYGHALSETSGWYSDYFFLVNNPWYLRGGQSGWGSEAGLYYLYYSGAGGGAVDNISFRVVLLE